ncbi:hypothetical protein CS8_078870 [Cupriavidus sp. 8B]
MSDAEPVLSPGTLEADKQLITVLLAQFNACRVEIQVRSASQAAVVNLRTRGARGWCPTSPN